MDKMQIIQVVGGTAAALLGIASIFKGYFIMGPAVVIVAGFIVYINTRKKD